MRKWRFTLTGLVVLEFVANTEARGDDHSTTRLTYLAPAQCPDESSFRDKVTARLGYDPFIDNGPRAIAVAISSRTDSLVGRATIENGDEISGTRQITSKIDQCEALTTALATTVAIALDPARSPPAQPAQVLPPPIPATRSPPEPPHVATQEPDAVAIPLVPSSPPGPTTQIQLFASAGVVGATASAPGATFGGEIGVQGRMKRFSLEVSARAEMIPGTARADSGDRLEATILTGAIYPCAHFGDFEGCLFARVGSFQSRAPDVVSPQLVSSAYGALGLRGAYTVPVGARFGIRGTIDGGIPLVRTSIMIDGGSVWTAPPAFVSASVSGIVQFM